MGNTGYFAPIDLDSIISKCDDCIHKLNTAKDQDGKIVSSNEGWTSNSKEKLKTALDTNSKDIEQLINQITKFKNALLLAKTIKESNVDVNDYSSAAMEQLRSRMKEFNSMINEI